MITVRGVGRLGLARALLAALAAPPAFAAGGSVCLLTDNTADGYFYSLSGSGSDRFIGEYPLSDACINLHSIICGARVREFNEGNPPFGTMQGDLRIDDPANPGYPDLSPAGLVAV